MQIVLCFESYALDGEEILELFIGVSRLPGPHDSRKFSYVCFIIYLYQPQIFKREGEKVTRKQV